MKSVLLRLKLDRPIILDSLRLERRGESEALGPVRFGVLPTFILSSIFNRCTFAVPERTLGVGTNHGLFLAWLTLTFDESNLIKIGTIDHNVYFLNFMNPTA